MKKDIKLLQQQVANLTELMKRHSHNGRDSQRDFESPIITGGIIQTARKDFRLRMDGDDNSYEFLYNDLVLAELVSTTVPFTGTSGAAFRHGTGTIMLEVSGSGEGLGGRQVVMVNGAGTKYFGMFDDDAGGYTIETNALPTSNPGGSGILWSDAGTVKIT